MRALMEMAGAMVDNAYAVSSQRVVRTARGAWEDFKEEYEQDRPCMLMQPRFAGDMAASLHNEVSLMLFAVWMLDNGLKPNTIGTYGSLVKTSLGVEYGWALTAGESAVRLPRMMKGIRRLQKRGERKKRLGWRAEYERTLHKIIGPPKGQEACTQAGLRRGLRQGLLRAADCLPEKASAFAPARHATLGDITFFDRPSPHLRWRVQPAKKSEQMGKTEYVYCPKGDGIADAYTAIKTMLEQRQRMWGKEQDVAPLFVDGSRNSWTVGQARALFKRSGEIIGIDPAELGAQSGRIGGATDLYATDAPAALLQIQGRW